MRTRFQDRRDGYADAVEGRPRMDVCGDYVVVARDVKTGSSGVEKASSPTYSPTCRERTVFNSFTTLYIVVEWLMKAIYGVRALGLEPRTT